MLWNYLLLVIYHHCYGFNKNINFHQIVSLDTRILQCKQKNFPREPSGNSQLLHTRRGDGVALLCLCVCQCVVRGGRLRV